MSASNPDKKRAAQSPAKFRGPAAGFDGRNLYVSNLPYQVRPVRYCVQRAWRMLVIGSSHAAQEAQQCAIWWRQERLRACCV